MRHSAASSPLEEGLQQLRKPVQRKPTGEPAAAENHRRAAPKPRRGAPENPRHERRYLVLADDSRQPGRSSTTNWRGPARSSSGRHLIEVRYRKDWMAPIRSPGARGGEGTDQPISCSQLDKVLTPAGAGERERPVRQSHIPRKQRPFVQRSLGVHQPPAQQLRPLLQGGSGREANSWSSKAAGKGPTLIRVQPIPINLITGFLGVGKTTAVRHLLANHRTVKWAVLVNEFGEVGVDGHHSRSRAWWSGGGRRLPVLCRRTGVHHRAGIA